MTLRTDMIKIVAGVIGIGSAVVIAGMARKTICWSILVPGAVAGNTLYSRMCPCQWELRIGMIKRSRLPCAFIMTLQTILREIP
ncbi:MAG TPA: hypothetical protein DEO84_01335, partial [candidate division Zixibacteria bacterium]|nr:hypothetical protein [candidate division Zixibacteria bacterium]